MTRWLITGCNGMLGRDLLAVLENRDVIACTRTDLDVTDAEAARYVIDDARPDVVANCAAWTAVDAAEEHEDAAFAVNAVGAANLARACAERSAALVHISTDYVFDGLAASPYAEDSPLSPRCSYGRTKAAGEWAVQAILAERSWIVRTAWLYGAGGPNFVRTMIRLESTLDTIDVVDDQQGQPTWSAQLARQVVRLVDTAAPAGVYHGTAAGQTTWYGLARAVFEELGADPDRIRPTTTDRFPRPAPRPAYSVLGHDAWSRAGLPAAPGWRDSLAQAFEALRKAA
jgi:dTDP-4-dehydrorhamnose reductase